MTYMLDTDTVSFFIRDNPKSIRERAAEHGKDEFCISAITLAELMYGLKRNYSRKLDFWLNEILTMFKVIDFDDTAAVLYGEIRSELEKTGEPLDNMDMLIAATALKANATLITHNTKHFDKIKRLKAEDWC